jgi:hypothetical protein
MSRYYRHPFIITLVLALILGAGSFFITHTTVHQTSSSFATVSLSTTSHGWPKAYVSYHHGMSKVIVTFFNRTTPTVRLVSVKGIVIDLIFWLVISEIGVALIVHRYRKRHPIATEQTVS